MMPRAWIAAIILAVVPAAYCSDGIRIAEIGLKGYYYPEYPVPVTVMVVHADPQPATVEIRVRVHSFPLAHSEHVSTFDKSILLAPNDIQAVKIPVLLQFSAKATVQVQEIDEHGALLGEDTQPLEPPLGDEFVIGILCARPDVCQQVQSQISYSGSEPQQTYKGKSLRFVTLESLYDQFWAYWPARTLVLARPTAGMTVTQNKALEDFAREGGALIVLEDRSSLPGIPPCQPRTACSKSGPAYALPRLLLASDETQRILPLPRAETWPDTRAMRYPARKLALGACSAGLGVVLPSNFAFQPFFGCSYGSQRTFSSPASATSFFFGNSTAASGDG